MSRHSFQVGTQRWHVGWDPAMASYFAQVEPLQRSGADAGDDPLRDVVDADRPGAVPTTLAGLRDRLRVQGSAADRRQRAARRRRTRPPGPPRRGSRSPPGRPGA